MQTYLETQQYLLSLLEEAAREGGVRIQRADGVRFILKPEEVRPSPLDVQGVDLGISTEEIVNFIREGREREGVPSCRS